MNTFNFYQGQFGYHEGKRPCPGFAKNCRVLLNPWWKWPLCEPCFEEMKRGMDSYRAQKETSSSEEPGTGSASRAEQPEKLGSRSAHVAEEAAQGSTQD